MNILVTGANGFIGKNLVSTLQQFENIEVNIFTKEHSLEELQYKILQADFIFHLAGVNRPKVDSEYIEGNTQLTRNIVNCLIQNKRKTPLLLTSSVQANTVNSYGESKKAAEKIVYDYQEKTKAKVFVYQLPNVFGKWSKPNYNTVIATFCHNISRDLPIKINNPDAELELVYIDDVINEFISCITIKEANSCEVQPVYKVKLINLANIIKSFKKSRNDLSIPNMENLLVKKLYSTYLSFLPEKDFSYELTMNQDYRGSFTEFIRTPDRGQVSVNVSKPGITKGNHWHHTKNEKFLVVSGKGLIRFRKIDDSEIIEYRVSGQKLTVVDIPVGYTHSIVNVGDTDLVTVMWVNEPFDPSTPDTIFLEV